MPHELSQEPHDLIAHGGDLFARVLDAIQDRVKNISSHLQPTVAATSALVDRGSREQPPAETRRSHGLSMT